METFSTLLGIFVGNSPVPGEFPAQKSVTRSFDAFFDLWINDWVNKGEAGDLRRHRVHYDVTVMAVYNNVLPHHWLRCTVINPIHDILYEIFSYYLLAIS